MDRRTPPTFILWIPAVPIIVLGLTAMSSAAIAHDLTLAWDRNREVDVVGYRVYYGSRPGDYTTVISAGASTTFTLTDLAAGEYCFAVTAYNTAGVESGFSNEVCAAIDVSPARPDGVATTGPPEVRVAATAATLSWKNTQSAAASVQWGTTAELTQTVALGDEPAPMQTAVLSDLAPDTTYFYRIRLVDAGGNLYLSPIASLTTQGTFSEEVRQSFVSPMLGPPPAAGGKDPYAGLALVNRGVSVSLVTLTALDGSGARVAGEGIVNPTHRILAPGESLAELDTQLFNAPMLSRTGSIRIDSTTANTTGMFLQFTGDLSEGDGWTPSVVPGNEWVLADLDPDAENRIFVSNPGDEPIRVEFELKDERGVLVAVEERTVAPMGTVGADAFSELFPRASAATSQYVRVQTSHPALVTGWIRRPGAWQRIQPGVQPGSGSQVLYAPQYVGGAGWRSTISVVNLDPEPGVITVEFVPEDGRSSRPPKSYPIQSRGKLRLEEPGLFADSESALRGFLVVSSDGIRLAGSISIGDSADRQYSTAANLESEPGSDAILPYVVADGTFFTGLVALNPSIADVDVSLELYARDGSILGVRTERIEPRQRRSKLLTELFPTLSTAGPVPGYVRIRANPGVIATALFWTKGLTMLSSIPATRVR